MKIKKIAVVLTTIISLTSCNTTSISSSNGLENNTQIEENYTKQEIETYDASSSKITQTFTSSPKRVITGNLSATETLFNLGVGDKIISMVTPDNDVDGEYKAQIDAIKKLGDKKTMSFETVINEEPDFIFSRVSSFAISKQNGVAKAGNLGTPSELNKLGINMYGQKASLTNASTIPLSYILDDVRNIGKIFNVEQKAEDYISELSKTIDDITTKLKDKGISQTENFKNAVIMTNYNRKDENSQQTYGIFKSPLQESALNLLGYTNYYTKAISGTSYTSEDLVKQSPDLIVYVTSTRNKDADSVAFDLMKENQAIQDVPAIKNNKMIKVNYDDFMDYGTRIFTAIESIYNFVYGE